MTQLIAYILFAGLGIAGALTAPATFALVMTMYPMEQLLQAAGGPFLAMPWLANVLIAGATGFSVVRLLFVTERPFAGYANLQLIGASVLLSWSLLSLLWTPSRDGAGQLVQEGYPYVALLVFLGPLLATGVDSFARFNRAILVAGTAIAAAMVASPEFRSWSGRLVTNLGGSTLSNPLVIGELGGTMVICAVLFRSTGASLAINLCRAAAFPLGAILALQSGSRGQLIFALLVCIAFYPVARRLTNVRNFVGGAIALSIGTVVFLYLAPIFVVGYGLNRWALGSVEGSALGRLDNIGDLLAAFRTDPVAWAFGMGYNAFSSVSSNAIEGYSHNLSVEVMAELGFPMFIVLMMMTVRAIRDGSRLVKRYGEDPATRGAIGLFLALAAYQYLLAQKQGTLWSDSTLFLMLVSLARIGARDQPEPASVPVALAA